MHEERQDGFFRPRPEQRKDDQDCAIRYPPCQQSSHTLGTSSSRQVDLWTTRLSTSIRQRGTSWRSSQRLGLRFAGPPYGATHALSAAQCPRAPKAAIQVRRG